LAQFQVVANMASYSTTVELSISSKGKVVT